MALADPIAIQTPLLIAGNVGACEIVVQGDDLNGVRLYGRVAAAMSALGLVLAALVVIWISIRFFGGQWGSWQTIVAMSAVVAVAAVSYLRAESRVRSYRLDLTADAVIFAYGRRRWYVPREHIQLFDTESSMLLRMFRLKRCNLHSAGGMVVVSPAPARVAAAIERLILEQPATAPADRADADS